MCVDIICWTCKRNTAALSLAAALMKSRSENMLTGFIPIFDYQGANAMLGQPTHRKLDAVGGVYLHNVMAFDPQNVGNKHGCLLRSDPDGEHREQLGSRKP